MKQASDAETKRAYEHLSEHGYVPSGFAWDGVTMFKLTDADVKRIEEGGPIVKADDPNALVRPAALDPST